jgi:hypothetical protein
MKENENPLLIFYSNEYSPFLSTLITTLRFSSSERRPARMMAVVTMVFLMVGRP